MREKIKITTKLPRYDLQSVARDFASQGLSIEDTLNCLRDGLLVAYRNTRLFLRKFDRLPVTYWKIFIDEDFRNWVNDGTLREHLVQFVSKKELILFEELTVGLTLSKDFDSALIERIPKELFSQKCPYEMMLTLSQSLKGNLESTDESLTASKLVIWKELNRIARRLHDRRFEIESETTELSAQVFAADLSDFLAHINCDPLTEPADRAVPVPKGDVQAHSEQPDKALAPTASSNLDGIPLIEDEAPQLPFDSKEDAIPIMSPTEERIVEEAKQIVDKFLSQYAQAQPNESEWKSIIAISLGRKKEKLKHDLFDYFSGMVRGAQSEE